MRTINNIVKKVFPRNGAENFPLNGSITIEFTEHMAEDSIDTSTISITTGKGAVPAKYEYSKLQKSLHITPHSLEPGQLYRVKIKSHEKGPVTVFGDVSAREYNFIFVTEGEKVIESPTEPETPPEGEVKPPVEETPEGPTEGQEQGKYEPTWEDVVNHTSKEMGIDSTWEDVVTNVIENQEVIDDPLVNESISSSLLLVDSFPSSGDLVDLDSHMVFQFNEPISRAKLEQNIFVKESKINPLLESLNEDKLIRGTVESQSDGVEDTTFTFKPNILLKPGTEYQLVIKEEAHSGLNYDIRINFQTLFERMFADVDTVRLVLGAFAERLTDLELAKLINQQSNSIYQLASMMDSFNESDWAQENGVIVTFPYAAGQYVVYSTAYYAILGRSLEGSSGMSESIKLADLSVSGSSESSDNLSDLLELLKAEFERWWDVLQGKAEVVEEGVPNPNYNMAVATRGGDQAPYPEFQTRVPFGDIGERGS